MRPPSYSSEIDLKHHPKASVTTSAFSNHVKDEPYHDYGVYLVSENHHLLICDSNPIKTPLYFAEIRRGKMKGRPGVKLYAANPSSIDPKTNIDGSKMTSKQGKTGTIIAQTYFPSFSSRVEIGYGDPDRLDTQKWETLTKKGCGKFEFLMPMYRDKEYQTSFHSDPSADRQAVNEGFRYVWQRTHSAEDGLDNAASARILSIANFKLLNEQGQIVALFISNGLKSVRKQGRLRIFRDRLGGDPNMPSGVDREVEMRIVMTYVSLLEKYTRG